MDIFEELSFDVEDVKKMNHQSSEFEDFCYQACHFYNFKEESIKKLGERIGADYNLILRLAEKYKDDKRFDYSDKVMSRVKREQYILNGFDKHNGATIEALLKVKTVTELKDIIENNHLSRRNFSQITGYLMNMYPNNYRKKIDRVQNLFEIYYHYKQEIKKVQKKIEGEVNFQKLRRKAFEFMNVVLKRDDIMRIDDIPEQMGLERREFLQYVKILKNEMICDERVYDLLLQKMEMNRKKQYCAKYGKSIYKILAIIDKPIKVGENFRFFDLLDCITYFGDDLPEIMEAVKVMFDFSDDSDDVVIKKDEIIGKIAMLKKILNYYHFEILKTYEGKPFHSDITDENVKKIWRTIIDSKIVLPYTDDLDRRELSDLEKEQIIRLMRLEKLPLSLFYFTLALKRFNDGKLEIITKDNIDEYIEEVKKEKC